MQTWSISYTTDRKKLKNRHWLQGKMNFNPFTSMAHFYDEDFAEIGKQKMRPDQIVADAEISLWRYLIEVGQLESTEDECVEDVFERLNRELGIVEFDQQTKKRQKIIEQPAKSFNTNKSIAPIMRNAKIPSKIDSCEPVVLYDILCTRDQGSDRVWQDGLLKFHTIQRLGEFYEGGDAGKLVHKKTMDDVREGELIEDACGGELTIEICAMRAGDSPCEGKKEEEEEADRVYGILYTTDKHKKSKKWLDGILSYSPVTHLAKFLADETHVCFYKKVMTGGVTVGEEMVTGIYIVQIDHEITQHKENTVKVNLGNISKKRVNIMASESVPLEGRSNDELLALLNQNNPKA